MENLPYLINLLFGILGITIGQEKGLGIIFKTWLFIIGFITGPFIIFTFLISSKIKEYNCSNCNAKFKIEKNLTKSICPNCKESFEIKKENKYLSFFL